MRKYLLTLTLLSLMMAQVAFAQSEANPHGISYKFLGVDTYTPYGYDSDTDGTREQLRFATTQMVPGISLGYHYAVKDWLVIGVPLRIGQIKTIKSDVFGDVLNAEDNFNDKELFIDVGALAKFQLRIKDKQVVFPYLIGGMSVSKIIAQDVDVQVPLGAGIDIRLGSGFYAQVQSEYRLSFDDLRSNMHHTAGFMFVLGEKDAPPPPPPPPPAPSDKDGDGIIDVDDKCPDVAGLAKFAGCPDTDGDDIQDSEDDCPEEAGTLAFKGCPDTDSDGLADKDDDCPTEAGPKSNKGCPIIIQDRDKDGVADGDDLCPDTPGKASLNGCPDTDGDGLADKDDECPKIAGSAANKGCPDTDGDGLVDKRDKCPKVKGPISNQGCPEMKQEDKETVKLAAQNIEFETGSSTIRTTSYKVLDEIVVILNKYPAYNASVSGHTDSVGAAASNQTLSENRAKSCYDYLISKGISSSRLSYAGYGETQPIASNDTKDGRQKNRRVVFNFFLK